MKTKFLSSILLIAAILFAQVGVVFAASPAQETTTITGTITNIVPETDANGTTTVLVTLVDANGVEQTVRISVDEAGKLGLVEVDSTTGLPVLDPTTGLPVVIDEQVGQTVDIDPTTVIADQPAEEEPVHPIAALLASFFDLDGSVVNQYHEDGFGFGVIAQALWMSKNLGGDASLAGQILEAKQSGDYSAFTLPDGSTPTNWGQFKKVVSDKKNNLGVVVSGKAQKDTDDQSAPQENGKGKGKNDGKAKGKNK